MGERIYVTVGDSLEAMEDEPFEFEDDLQALLAKHPKLLDGEQMQPGNPRRWLLITREKGVADAPEESARWSLDHLFVDQDAVPTLVEVKRGRNSQVRREVVGQMLDYAANASQFWTLDEIRQAFERTHEGSDTSADAVLEEFLREDWNPEAFWEQVATNLAARRLRLLFVADAIPPELVRIVEFLNAQMRDNVEVLAVEIKRFKGESQTQTLVPRVIGHTAAPPGKSAAVKRARTKVTMEEFMDQLPTDDVRKATLRLFDVAHQHKAMVIPGDKGFSIRMNVPDYRAVSVAWLYPTSGVSFWLGMRDYSFGADLAYHEDLPVSRYNALKEWIDVLRENDFGTEFLAGGIQGRRMSHDEVARHVDELSVNLAKVLGGLHGEGLG